MAALDHKKLAKVLALAGSDQDGEALAALRKAQGMLKAMGKTFADLTVKEPVGKVVQARLAAGPSFVDIFTGFDDHMEAKEPGWKAKQAAAHAERLKREAAEREAAIAKYGSERAAKMPTSRERVLNKATANLKQTVRKEWNGKGYNCDTLDGWSYGDSIKPDSMPATVRIAVAGAFPMPTTLREAREEYRWWVARDRELERVWCKPGEVGGDTYLPLPAIARRELVWRLWRDGPITTLDDLLVRMEMSAEWGDHAGDLASSNLEAFNQLVMASGASERGGAPLPNMGVAGAKLLDTLDSIRTIASEMGHDDTLGFEEARERILEAIAAARAVSAGGAA